MRKYENTYKYDLDNIDINEEEWYYSTSQLELSDEIYFHLPNYHIWKNYMSRKFYNNN